MDPVRWQQVERLYHAERTPGMIYLKVDPRADIMRADPRVQALLRRMTFPAS